MCATLSCIATDKRSEEGVSDQILDSKEKLEAAQTP